MADVTDIGFTSADPIRAPIEQLSKDRVKAPKILIPTPSGARSIYYSYRSEHLKRIKLYSQIEGLIAGNPPYNPLDLAQHGLTHISNFNTLDARSLFDRGALAYWNLINQAETLCKFEIIGDDAQLVDWSQILAKNWDLVVRRWPGFYTNINTLMGQLVKFGLSPCIWSDERDWRWRTIELQRFFVEDQAQSDVEMLTCIFVESIFTAQYLFEVYDEFKDKQEDSPWNIDELVYLLMNRANTWAKNQGLTIVDFMDLQRKLQNGDLTYDNVFSDGIRLVSMLSKEYSGKITHAIFDRWLDNGNFLYHVPDQYDTLQEGLVIFTASPGEFTLHSNRGLGHKIFSGAQAMMQLDCATVDMAKMASTPFIKSLATGTKDFSPIRVYPGVVTNIGTAELVQTNFGANVNQLIGTSQYILQKLNYNTANSGDDPSTPDRNQGSISPTQAKMRSYKEFGVLKNNIAHFYSQFDIVVRNMVIKMLKSKKGYPGYEYAEEWKQRCLEEGVPEQVFDYQKVDVWGMPKQLKVKATRVAGDGSTLALLMGLESLQPIMADFGPREAREYKRQYIIATMGADYVPAFLNKEDDADSFAGGASLAGVENAVMRMGESPVFSPDNDHRAHIVTHLALGNDIIRRMQQQQMDAVQADKMFVVLMPHLGEHMQAIAQSPFAQSFFQQVKPAYTQIEQYARLNAKNASAMMQKQLKEAQALEEENQKVMTEEELKTLQVQNEEVRKDLKVSSQIDRAKQASDQRGAIMRDKAVMDAQNERLRITLENQNKKIENEGKSSDEIRQEIATRNGATPSPYDIESR